jgi:hypothetical protein
MGALRTQVVRSSVLLVVLSAASGHAQESWVRIEYTAPPDCPSEADFIEQVLIRTRRARLAGPGDLAHTLKIAIESQPGQSVARLEFVDTDSQRVEREVSGEECGEVVSGIALVTAIAIDARAEKQAAQAPPAGPLFERTKPPAQPPPHVTPVRGAPTASAGTRPRWDAGLGFLTTSAVAPSLLYGLEAFVAVGPRNARWSARLTLAYLKSPNLNVARGEARFQLAFARAEACPLALSPTAHLALLPCAAFDAGIMAASGGGVPDPKSPKAFWSGASLIGRMQLDLQDFLLFEVQGELGTPFTRERFYFEQPEATAHTVDSVRWGMGAAVGVRF